MSEWHWSEVELPESQHLSKARKKMIYLSPTYVISHLEACLTVSSVHPENELKNRRKLERFRTSSDLQYRSDQVQCTQWYIVGPVDFPCHDEIVLKCKRKCREKNILTPMTYCQWQTDMVCLVVYWYLPQDKLLLMLQKR